MIKVIWNRPSVIEGMISAFSPETVRRPVLHQPSFTTSPRPNDGSQFRITANK